MADKTFNARFIHKHDTAANWLKTTNFIPQKGEIIVYDIDADYNYERFKIGDGNTEVNALPFADGAIKNYIDTEIATLSDDISDVRALVGDTSVSSQISSAIASKADTGHTHDDRYYTESEINTKLSAKSDVGHTHEIADLTNLNDASVKHATTADTANSVAWDNVTDKPDTYAPATHSHPISDVTNLQTTLNSKVPTSRTVNGKALSANITLSASDVGADASGSSSSALTSAKEYTDAEIAEWVGDETVSDQIASAVATKADASHTHDDRYYTETEIDTKLSGKSDTSHTHSAYVNQNAFSNIKVGETTVAADSATDTITLVAGSNITITPDATNDKITIAANDTIYTHPSSGVTAGTYKSVTVNAQGHVTGGTNPTTLSGYGIIDAAAKSHSHSAATTSSAGFMSASDKAALDEVIELVGDTSVADQIAEAIASKSDVGHTHTAAQVGADPSGSAASALSSAKSYTDTKISDLINSAPTTLDTLGEIATAMTENEDVVAALEEAVGTKANASDLTSHTGNKSNPHGVTLSQLGVTATAAELNYVDGVTSNVQTQLNAKVPTSRTVNGKALSANITLSASDVGADTSGAANTALTNAKSYTDTQIAEMVGDDTVANQISAAIDDVTLASLGVTATAAELNKLDGVTATTTELNYVDGVTSNIQTQLNAKAASNHTHSTYANQNAFSNISVGSTTIAADTTTDTLTLAGSNITLTPDVTNDKVTIGITKDNVVAALGYTPPTTNTTYSAAGTSLGLVKSGGDVTIASGVITVNDDSHNHTVANIDGLQDKLDLIGDTSVSEQISSAVDGCITGLSVSGKVITYTKGDGTSGTITTQDTNTTYSAAGSSLGLVKSGGDVTISSGVITVNDDSHNHTIANVDNLQTTLDGKAAKNTGVFYIEGTGDTAGTWLGSHDSITEYYAGLMIAYKPSIAGASGLTLNINNLGAVSVIRNISTALTTQYGVGSVVFLVYTIDSDGTAYWKVADYDSDTKTRSSNKTGTKMYIIGAASQSTSGQTTYSNKNCYIGTDNCLYSGGAKVATSAEVTAVSDLVGDTAVATQISNAVATKADSSHTHNYAGSSSAGGAATSANKLNTDAGSATNPVYFANGVPVKTTYTLGASVPSGAKFTDTVYTHPSYTARTGVPTANATPAFGGTFSVSQPVSDATGHITAINSRTITIPNSVATTSAAGLMSAADKTTLNNLTTLVGDTAVSTQISTAVATKADSNHAHSAYVNQNAFSNIAVDSTTVAADSATDTLTLAGSNVTLTPDATNDKITIGITKANVVAALGYTPPTTNTTYSAAGSSLGLVKSGGDVTISSGVITVNDDSHNHTVANVDGLQNTLDSLSTLVGDTAVATQISNAAATKADIDAGVYAVTASSSDGVTYTATVPGITALTAGVSFIMIPGRVSASTSPTINVNGLGAKYIKRRLSNLVTSVQAGYTANWLAANNAFTLTYDGTQWIVEGLTKPVAADLYGTLSVAKGGTGATTAVAARENLLMVVSATEPESPTTGMLWFDIS